MTNITKEPFTVVYKYDTGVFGVIENVKIEYDPTSTVPLDDRIRRIDTGVYLGSLIQNPEMMVYQPGKQEDDLKKLLADYFSAYDPVIIHAFGPTCKPESVVSTDFIREFMFQKFRSDDISSFHQIYSDNKEGTKPGIIRIPRDDFSSINIKEYTEIPALSQQMLTRLETGKTFKYTTRGHIAWYPMAFETYYAVIEFETIDGVNLRFPLLKYDGFFDGSKELITIGPQEYTIFFEIESNDTDTVYINVHSVLLPVSPQFNKRKYFYNDISMNEIIPNIHNISRTLSLISQKTGLDRISFNIETKKCVKFRDNGYTYIPVPIRNYSCDEVDYFHVDVVNTGYDPSNKLRCDIEVYPYSLENDTILNDKAEITIEGVDEERLLRFLNPETFIDELISSAPKYFTLEE